ncbi:WXG100 family type VII secretion target [Embleya sp. MST-111070]|uniref:WXG100 family type VII secretion target n=1 Tax=Embleya sp. MST-111070 TaxID=3398231 RepID=UPI003F734E24
MATKDFRVDPEQIRGTIPAFTTQAERLRVAAETFKRELAELGAPWGDDDNGRKFGTPFLESQVAIIKSADILAQGMASIGPTLAALADNVVRTDQANAEKLS